MIKKLVFALLVLAPCAAWASTPQISSITVTASQNELDVVYYSSPDAYCWVQYGTSTANYQWASTTYLSGNGGTFIDHLCSLTINGLKAGTTYYLLPTARPDPDDEVNICSTTLCGTRELSSATLPSGLSSYPAAPASVASQMLLEPNTSNYAFVTLISSITYGECYSSTTVSAPSGYSWTINANETLTQIIANGAFTPGTVFQIPQGSTCAIPSTDLYGHGYLLPGTAADPHSSGYDDPNHRWIILRTSSGSAADFPPFGKRTNPSFFNHYATFISTNPDSYSTGAGGVIFSMLSPGTAGATAYAVNHLWVENLKFTVDATQTTKYFDGLFFLANPQGDGGDAGIYPEYIVFRDNYFHYPYRANQQTGTPSMQFVITGTANKQLAFVGNYSDNANYGSSGIEQNLELTDTGFKGSTTTASDVLIDNNMFSGMAMNTYIEVNNHFNAPPTDYSITHNTYYYPWSTLAYAKYIDGGACRNQIEFKGSERLLIKGNFINGQWACQNTGQAILLSGLPLDDTIMSNYFTNVNQPFATTGTGTDTSVVGYYTSGNRQLFTNNAGYTIGRGTFSAGGGGIIMPIMELDSTPSNLTFINNTIGPMDDSGGGFYAMDLYLPGNGALAGLTFSNNILPYAANGSGAGGIFAQDSLCGNNDTGTCSHPYTPLPLSRIAQIYTTMLGSAAGYADGVAGNGMAGVSVISGGSGYSNGSFSFSNCPANPSGTYSVSGGVINNTYGWTSFGVCLSSAMTVSASGSTGASLRPHYGLTPNYNWGGNYSYCTTYEGSDSSQANCTSMINTMPPGDFYASGNNTSSRTATIGLTNISNGDLRCTPTSFNSCYAGANFAQMESDLGLTSHINVQTSSTSLTFNYVAPDSTGCYVDISTNAVNWTRESDSGGTRQRSLAFNGLTTSTSYSYRILCYTEQDPKSWLTFPEDASNLTTDGTVSTLSTTVKPISFNFNLGTFSGATSFVATLTAPSGTVYTSSTTVSPETLYVPVGDYTATLNYFNNVTSIAASDSQILSVR